MTAEQKQNTTNKGMRKKDLRKGKPPLMKHAGTTSFKRENLPQQVHLLFQQAGEDTLKKRDHSSSSQKMLNKGKTYNIDEDCRPDFDEFNSNLSPRALRPKSKTHKPKSKDRPSSEKSNRSSGGRIKTAYKNAN